MRAWLAKPENRAKARAYRAKPEYLAKERARRAKPENRAKARAYRATPGYRAKARARACAWWAEPENRARARARQVTPEYRAKQRARIRAWRAKPENRAKERARIRAWQAKPENRARARLRRAKPENRIAAYEQNAAWYKANREKAQAKQRAQRLRKAVDRKVAAAIVAGKFTANFKRTKEKPMTISQAKRRSFLERFNALEGQQRALDYQKSVLAHDIRSEFPDGARGDEAFLTFIGTEYNLYNAQAQLFLGRAKTIDHVPDELQYKQAGGSATLLQVIDWPKKQVADLLKRAEIEHKRPATLIREAAAQGKTPAVPNYRRDAQQLASFLSTLSTVTMPPMIAAIVQRYARRKG